MNAREEYIKLCHAAFKAINDVDFHIKRSRCEGYSQAMKDILGLDHWGSIVMATDLSFPDDVPVCAGVPIYSELQLKDQKETTDGLHILEMPL